MQRRNRWRSALVFGLTGWLFADLFIALTMGFVANIVGYPPTPTPMPTVITPTITPQPALGFTPITITLTVNSQALISGDPSTIASVEQQIKSKYGTALACKRAGFVLTFGGAPTDNDTGYAIQVARAFNQLVFKDLGTQNYVFNTARYREFITLKTSPNTITANVYVFDNVNTCLSAETGNTLDLAT